jgi:hypothetical protein
VVATELIDGRYAVLDEIASGGMATVHLGTLVGPAGFTRIVAIKKLLPELARDPEFAVMFLDEARMACRVQHPNVVSTLDAVRAGTDLLLVMESKKPTPRRVITAAGFCGDELTVYFASISLRTLVMKQPGSPTALTSGGSSSFHTSSRGPHSPDWWLPSKLQRSAPAFVEAVPLPASVTWTRQYSSRVACSSSSSSVSWQPLQPESVTLAGSTASSPSASLTGARLTSASAS